MSKSKERFKKERENRSKKKDRGQKVPYNPFADSVNVWEILGQASKTKLTNHHPLPEPTTLVIADGQTQNGEVITNEPPLADNNPAAEELTTQITQQTETTVFQLPATPEEHIVPTLPLKKFVIPDEKQHLYQSHLEGYKLAFGADAISAFEKVTVLHGMIELQIVRIRKPIGSKTIELPLIIITKTTEIKNDWDFYSEVSRLLEMTKRTHTSGWIRNELLSQNFSVAIIQETVSHQIYIHKALEARIQVLFMKLSSLVSDIHYLEQQEVEPKKPIEIIYDSLPLISGVATVHEITDSILLGASLKKVELILEDGSIFDLYFCHKSKGIATLEDFYSQFSADQKTALTRDGFVDYLEEKQKYVLFYGDESTISYVLFQIESNITKALIANKEKQRLLKESFSAPIREMLAGMGFSIGWEDTNLEENVGKLKLFNAIEKCPYMRIKVGGHKLRMFLIKPDMVDKSIESVQDLIRWLALESKIMVNALISSYYQRRYVFIISDGQWVHAESVKHLLEIQKYYAELHSTSS